MLIISHTSFSFLSEKYYHHVRMVFTYACYMYADQLGYNTWQLMCKFKPVLSQKSTIIMYGIHMYADQLCLTINGQIQTIAAKV